MDDLERILKNAGLAPLSESLEDQAREDSARRRAAFLATVADEDRLPNLHTVLPPEHLHPVVRARPEHVTIYRAVPEAGMQIRPGDWVALSRRYAASMGRGHVVSMRVPAADVAWAGTDVNEYTYAPRSS